MKSAGVRFWLSFLLMALSAYGIYTGWKIYDRLSANGESAIAHAPKVEVIGRQVQPFKLTERSGREFDSNELDGQVWVASFFFSSCPGACIKMNNTIAGLQEELKESGVKFVSISVDPDNDSPEELQKYARHFGADPDRWLFLTGPAREIQRLANDDFQVAFGRSAHSDRLMLVDRHGKVQGAYSAAEDASVLLLKRKLAELISSSSSVVNGALPTTNN